MSSSNGKRRREPYTNGKSSPSQPGDERDGEWPRERLIEMDRRFVERVERAIALGLERRERAADPRL
jgi:hypothetical protein